MPDSLKEELVRARYAVPSQLSASLPAGALVVPDKHGSDDWFYIDVHVCSDLHALGPDIRPNSRAIGDVTLLSSLTRSFDLDISMLDTLNTRAGFEAGTIRSGSLTFTGARNVYLDGKMPISATPSPICIQSIMNQMRLGRDVVMIKEAVVADVQYVYHMDSSFGVDASASVPVVAPVLSANVGTAHTDGVRAEMGGSQMVWGVKTDRGFVCDLLRTGKAPTEFLQCCTNRVQNPGANCVLPP